MVRIYELQPIHENRQSYYKKAHVVLGEGTDKVLISYDTLVVKIEEGKPIIYGFFSHTTLRHIKEFLRQEGYPQMSKKELEQYLV